MENVYKNLSGISVTDKVETKGRFDYLSWAYAWHYIKQEYPNAQRIVYENSEGVPYFTDGKFGNVKVGIVIEGNEHIDYLPITDNSNRSIPLTKITSFDVNTAIQRSTTKAIAMHGLGLSLWIGEDTAQLGRLNDVKKTAPVKEAKTYELKVEGEDWIKVLKYIAKHKEKGLDWIVKQISVKHEVTTSLKNKIKKELNAKK